MLGWCSRCWKGILLQKLHFKKIFPCGIHSKKIIEQNIHNLNILSVLFGVIKVDTKKNTRHLLIKIFIIWIYFFSLIWLWLKLIWRKKMTHQKCICCCCFVNWVDLCWSVNGSFTFWITCCDGKIYLLCGAFWTIVERL